MSKTIVIAPYSRKLRGTDKENPKNYPFFEELIKLLKDKDFRIVQLGVEGEKQLLGVDEFIKNLSLKEISKIVKEAFGWVSVDSYLPHLANLIGKPGVVIFSQSDPLIFGHAENKNLLKDRKYLRSNQFGTWEEAEYNKEAFVEPERVLNALLGE